MARVPGDVGRRTGTVLRSPLLYVGLVAALAATLLVPALSFLLIGIPAAAAAYALRPLLPGMPSVPRMSLGGATRILPVPGGLPLKSRMEALLLTGSILLAASPTPRGRRFPMVAR